MKDPIRFEWLYIILITFFLTCPSYAITIFVNEGAGGANNGSNWTDAYTSLSDALAIAVPGDQIWVAQGVYKPSVVVDFNGDGVIDPREATFYLPSSVEIYGGFTGTETMLNERDWEAYKTILSGDLDNNDVNTDGNNIAETFADAVGNNAYHVVYTSNVSNGTVLDGFIITAGTANIPAPLNIFDPNLDGGGWYNRLSGGWNASSPTIVNTIFSGNLAGSEGGGMYNLGTLNGEIISVIDNCTFTGNRAEATGGAVYLGSFDVGNYEPHIKYSRFINNEAHLRGGALYLVGDHSVVDSCVFTGNKTTAVSPDFSTLPGSGGAANLVASNAMFSNCMFTGNSSTGNPTGAFEGGGGGAVNMSSNEPQTLELGDSSPKFVSCGFYSNSTGGNTAAWGGAVNHLSDAGRLFPVYINCVFYDNEAQTHGGAVSAFIRLMGVPAGATPALEPEFTNCTFAGNSAGQRGGVIYTDGQEYSGNEMLRARFENSILWDNTAGTEGDQVYNTAYIYITYSLVEGSGGSGGGWDVGLGADGGNNIDDDPLFADQSNPYGADLIAATLDDGLNLSLTSPAINAGNDGAPGLAGVTKDYINGDRIQSGAVDIGAYERCGVIIEPPLNPDIYWLTNWKDSPCLNCPPSWSFILLNTFNINFFKNGALSANEAQVLEKDDGEKTSSPLHIIPDFPQKLAWDGPAQFIDYGDSALITGNIKNIYKKGFKFKVHIKLINPSNWESWKAMHRTYIAFTFPVLKAALSAHKNWTYWIVSGESYMEGTGDISGKLALEHWPANKKTGFQFGEGANGWDNDNGLGGLFAYKGKVKYLGKQLTITGLGSLNADAELCETDCDPLEKNITADEETEEVTAPKEFSLKQNYPNPFNPVTNISFSVPGNESSGLVTLKIYDILGNEVVTLVNEEKPAGYYNVQFNAAGLSSGIYFYKLTYGNFSDTKKLVLLK
jgi:predicted outer membrane repeat protein